MKGVSPWALSALKELKHTNYIHLHQLGAVVLKVTVTSDSVWATICNKGRTPIHFRACFVPSGKILGFKAKKMRNGIALKVGSLIGGFNVEISLDAGKFHMLRYTSTLIPHAPLFIPFWPRDILLQNNEHEAICDFGEVHCVQRQTRSGLIYFSKMASEMRVLYFQNLTSLSDYCEQTGTSLSGVVGGSLPEVGLLLPPSLETPLKKGRSYIISDAHICLKPEFGKSREQAVDYLDMLAEVYSGLQRPLTKYRPWPKILENGLKDLIENPGCWSRVGGNNYLNAYLCDYQTPPEIMVQLAVLLPILDYQEWSGQTLKVTETIRKGLPAFYNKELKTLLRWHPGAEDKLNGEEEQKKPLVMDSWYLHHPLLNLSRLALKGDMEAKNLLLNSIGFAIKVAHKFKYVWPVFYKMDTLEVLKAETEPGKGGEQDVAGLYTHVMLQAYELTKEDKYLNEAVKASNKLSKVGNEVMYQANNTAFAAGALLRLYKITGKQLYLTLSYRCLASLFQNVQLWDCNYGHGKNLPTFFALFPLTDAPYTAAYEEQEVFCAFHDYLEQAVGLDILPSVKLLCGEYIRYLIDRAPFYYPPMLPQEMLSNEIKTGEVEKDLWIALEDIHDGIEESGAVGQEVYGAGNAFGILPRHFIRIEGEPFMVFIDGPYTKVQKSKTRVRFQMIGHENMHYNLKIVLNEQESANSKLTFNIKISGSTKQIVNTEIDHPVNVSGDTKVEISWNE